MEHSYTTTYNPVWGHLIGQYLVTWLQLPRYWMMSFLLNKAREARSYEKENKVKNIFVIGF